ncbi:MAG: hypothetical protein ABIZ80_05170 [Bryobacteraceae bacterium]
MTRREFAAAAGAAVTRPGPQATADSRLNILWISREDAGQQIGA